MTKRSLYFTFAICLAALAPLVGTSQEVLRDDKGMVTGIKYLPIDSRFLNPIDSTEEAAWWSRVRAVLRADTMNANGTFQAVDDQTSGESEKRSYPCAFWHILAGDAAAGMKVLEKEDDQAGGWNAYTEGIDLWFGFTVQGQVTKYFFTGPLMTPAYKERMDRAIKTWTLTNPQHTPHPMYLKYNPAIKDGWGPDRFGNRRVDPRRTDAMWGFTTTAVYLFAEASGNEATRLEAKDEILRYVWSLYHVGMGEWDSSTYSPYSIAPYLNLHAYARDPEVRMAAKLALDYYYTADALTYRHGLFSGPSKRDYGNAYQMYAGSFNTFFPMIFGDARDVQKSAEHYTAYPMLSPYRPAPAMLALARRQLDKPVEVLAAKPPYETWKMPGDAGPDFFETMFLAKSYDLGSVVSAHGADDVSPFRLVFDRGDDQADLFTATSGPRFPQMYNGDAIGQYRNLLVWISPPDGAGRFDFALPSRIPLVDGGAWKFADAGKTWIALQSFGLDPFQPEGAIDPHESELRAGGFGAASFYVAKRHDSSPGGFAMIVAEAGDFASFDAFRQAVAKSAALDVSKLAQGTARLRGVDGAYVEVTRSDAGLPVINRNGAIRKWDDPANWSLWQTVGGDLLSLGWKQGTLTLDAGGKTFTGTVKARGLEDANTAPSTVETASGIQMTASFANQ